MRATKLHTQDAVLQLHPRTGGCSGILREKRPFTTPTHTSFWPCRGKGKYYTHSVIWLLQLYEPRVDACWLFLSSLEWTHTHTVWQHKLTAKQHHRWIPPRCTRTHSKQTFTLLKITKIRKCTEMTCRLASHTIALSFIHPVLHLKTLVNP